MARLHANVLYMEEVVSNLFKDFDVPADDPPSASPRRRRSRNAIDAMPSSPAPVNPEVKSTKMRKIPPAPSLRGKRAITGTGSSKLPSTKACPFRPYSSNA